MGAMRSSMTAAMFLVPLLSHPPPPIPSYVYLRRSFGLGATTRSSARLLDSTSGSQLGARWGERPATSVLRDTGATQGGWTGRTGGQTTGRSGPRARSTGARARSTGARADIPSHPFSTKKTRRSMSAQAQRHTEQVWEQGHEREPDRRSLIERSCSGRVVVLHTGCTWAS